MVSSILAPCSIARFFISPILVSTFATTIISLLTYKIPLSSLNVICSFSSTIDSTSLLKVVLYALSLTSASIEIPKSKIIMSIRNIKSAIIVTTIPKYFLLSNLFMHLPHSHAFSCSNVV